MIRKIIKIDESKCNGCGACASACHEGAIEMIGGVAKLTKENYCDGLGDCLPACPTGAITFEMREAPAYDEAAVLAAKKAQNKPAFTCPGTAVQTMKPVTETPFQPPVFNTSKLAQWPAQIKLVPIAAPFFNGADLLIAADCTAFAYGDFHNRFMAGRVTLIGCPKLDAVDYSEKLSAIFAANDIKSITLTRMQVPCCGGMEYAVKKALQACGKDIPLNVVTISVKGDIL